MRRAARLRSFCALGLCAVAFAASAQEAALPVPAADTTVAPEIDRLLAVSRIGQQYQKLLSLLFVETPPADPVARAEYDLLRRVYSRLTWSRLRAPWREALAQRITPAQARTIIDFYESEPGRALVACFDAALSPGAMAACGDGIDGPHADAVAEYMRSPEGTAFERSLAEAVDLAMPYGVRQLLAEDSALAAEAAVVCRTSPELLICTAQSIAADAAKAP
jgi:hypothetical protein